MSTRINHRLKKLEARQSARADRKACLIFGPKDDAALHFDGRFEVFRRGPNESANEFEERARREAQGEIDGALLRVLSNAEYLQIEAHLDEYYPAAEGRNAAFFRQGNCRGAPP
jgi:hypothetical protein